MRSPFAVLIILIMMVLLDRYIYLALKTVTGNASPNTTSIVFTIYWIITIGAIIMYLLFVLTGSDFLPKNVRTYMFAIVVGLFFSKIVSFIFFFVDDIRRGVTWIVQKLFVSNSSDLATQADGISRSVFLSWLGLAAGGTLFTTLLYGFSNKYDYQVKRLSLDFENLPPAFNGLKLAHFSDVHSGSFTDKEAVKRGIDMIMTEKPDLIVFSGDLVNNEASEIKPYLDIFSKLQAPLGIYSTLGNHDYGDYISWPIDGVTKQQNLLNLARHHAQLGWRLLMNEHFPIKKGGDEIAILGIENWSAKARFPKYGDMAKAYAGSEKYPFKILVSHDPSHWDAQVITQYSDVDVTLSGHTHGMQFGVEIPGFKWSPVQYVYKEWAGLYEEGKQKLYVNRGYGFIGYPGRVGILPEITLLEFTNKKGVVSAS
ncbi:metallophosphoesterase [soil metagenome]